MRDLPRLSITNLGLCMRKSLIAFILIFIYIFLFQSFLQAKDSRGLKIKDKQGREVGLYKESHALVIGASDYTAGWPVLPGVKKDIQVVKSILEKHGFIVTLVINPDRYQLFRAFYTFINEHGFKPDNRLLFYFAGHGHTIRLAYGEEMGYIVPTDAPNPNRDHEGFLTKAMDMQQIEVYAKRIQSKHALFLFDSCFSGSIFALSRAIPENISYKTSKPVRQFITSGSADEKVPDESIFRTQFIAALDGEGDVDKDGYVTGAELGEFLQKKVINYSKGSQHPQYGKIRNPNLDKGDFVFMIGKVRPKTIPSIDNDDRKQPIVNERDERLNEFKLLINQNITLHKVKPNVAIVIESKKTESGFSPENTLYNLLQTEDVNIIVNFFKEKSFKAKGFFRELYSGNTELLKQADDLLKIDFLILGRLNYSFQKGIGINRDLISCKINFNYKVFNKNGNIVKSDSIYAVGPGFSDDEALKRGLEILTKRFSDTIFKPIL